MEQGVDYSWARPGGAALAAAGKKFACRYIPYDGHAGKGLEAAERDDLRSHGINIVLVFESYAGRAREGRAAGKADGEVSKAKAAGLGFPTDRPIYFAIDFDATPQEQGVIDEYLRGAAEALGADRVGVYGGFYVVKRCKENGTAKWYWQTFAWSGGAKLDGRHLYQYLNGQPINGGEVDFNEGYGDYGAWLADGKAVNPAPAPAPASGDYIVKSGDSLSGIATAHGLSLDRIKQLNPQIANPNLIYPGEAVHLGGQPQQATPGGQTYEVQRGDNLTAIAQKFGTSVDALARLNNIANPNLIYAGQVLRVSGAAAAPPAPGGAYTVKKNDTLSGIAGAHGLSLAEIERKNPQITNPNLIFPGQQINI